MKMTADQVCELIKANEQGKKFQYLSHANNQWVNSHNTFTETLHLIYTRDYIYRVKPEPQVIYIQTHSMDGVELNKRRVILLAKEEVDYYLSQQPSRKFKKFVEVVD